MLRGPGFVCLVSQIARPNPILASAHLGRAFEVELAVDLLVCAENVRHDDKTYLMDHGLVCVCVCV